MTDKLDIGTVTIGNVTATIDNAMRDARLAALEAAVLALLGAGVTNSGIGPTAATLREAIEQARTKK